MAIIKIINAAMSCKRYKAIKGKGSERNTGVTYLDCNNEQKQVRLIDLTVGKEKTYKSVEFCASKILSSVNVTIEELNTACDGSIRFTPEYESNFATIPDDTKLLEKVEEKDWGCGFKGFIYKFLKDYEGVMTIGFANDSIISGNIFVGKNYLTLKEGEIIRPFSFDRQGVETINVKAKVGDQLVLSIKNGEALRHEDENKRAKCGETNSEVLAKGVNHASYRIGFGGEEQYTGEFDTAVYIPKPESNETSGGGGSSNDNNDLPSASSGQEDSINPGGYGGGWNYDSYS